MSETDDRPGAKDIAEAIQVVLRAVEADLGPDFHAKILAEYLGDWMTLPAEHHTADPVFRTKLLQELFGESWATMIGTDQNSFSRVWQAVARARSARSLRAIKERPIDPEIQGEEEAREILDRISAQLAPLEDRVQRLVHSYGL